MERQGVVFDKKNKGQATEAFKLEQLSQAASQILFKAKTVFPFDLFQDRVVIDKNKVDLIVGTFFFTNEVYSIPIKNINGATSTNILFFGTLIIEIVGYNVNPPPIRFLKTQDALTAQHVINGLVICMKQNINIEGLKPEYLRRKVEEIGRSTKSP